jgi:hypothetical protein
MDAGQKQKDFSAVFPGVKTAVPAAGHQDASNTVALNVRADVFC